MQPTDQDLQLLSEYDSLLTKYKFAPHTMSKADKKRFSELHMKIIPPIYVKLGM